MKKRHSRKNLDQVNPVLLSFFETRKMGFYRHFDVYDDDSQGFSSPVNRGQCN